MFVRFYDVKTSWTNINLGVIHQIIRSIQTVGTRAVLEYALDFETYYDPYAHGVFHPWFVAKMRFRYVLDMIEERETRTHELNDVP